MLKPQITVQHHSTVLLEYHCQPAASLASGKAVFSSEETDHHVAQQDSHLGAAHHQPAVGARDRSSTQTTPNTNSASRTNPRPRTHGGPLLSQNFWHALSKKRNNKQKEKSPTWKIRTQQNRGDLKSKYVWLWKKKTPLWVHSCQYNEELYF